MAKEKNINVSPTGTEAPKKLGIKILCHGGYYYKDEKTKGVKPFNYAVRAPSLEIFREETKKYLGTDDKGIPQYKVNSFLNIRGQLKKRILPLLLGRMYHDFARVRYVVIDEIISEDGSNLDLPIQLRSRNQLAQYIRERDMPIDVNDYMEIDDLRSDILEFLTDADVFMKNKPGNKKKRQDERDFMEMNDMSTPLPPLSKNKDKKEEPVSQPASINDIL